MCVFQVVMEGGIAVLPVCLSEYIRLCTVEMKERLQGALRQSALLLLYSIFYIYIYRVFCHAEVMQLVLESCLYP